MYLIQSGRVRTPFDDAEGQQIVLAEPNRDFFGEMSLTMASNAPPMLT